MPGEPLTHTQVETAIAAHLHPPIRKMLARLDRVEAAVHGLPSRKARETRTLLDSITFALDHPTTLED